MNRKWKNGGHVSALINYIKKKRVEDWPLGCPVKKSSPNVACFWGLGSFPQLKERYLKTKRIWGLHSQKPGNRTNFSKKKQVKTKRMAVKFPHFSVSKTLIKILVDSNTWEFNWRFLGWEKRSITSVNKSQLLSERFCCVEKGLKFIGFKIFEKSNLKTIIRKLVIQIYLVSTGDLFKNLPQEHYFLWSMIRLHLI